MPKIKKFFTRKPGSGGFTLVELLFAFGILAFVLAALLGLFISCVVLNSGNRNLTTAVSHTQHITEEIRSIPFNQISAQIDAGQWNLNTAALITAHNLVPLVNEQITATYNPASPDPLDVLVTVNWNDLGGRNRSTALETLITN